MHIEHVALWTTDLDRLERFYTTYFQAVAGPRYHNSAKGFTSFFLRFAQGARIEVMTSTSIAPRSAGAATCIGLAHFAVAVGGTMAVDELTERLRRDGHPVVDGPRRTGDGYYESVVLDPDGNRVELVGDGA